MANQGNTLKESQDNIIKTLESAKQAQRGWLKTTYSSQLAQGNSSDHSQKQIVQMRSK